MRRLELLKKKKVGGEEKVKTLVLTFGCEVSL